MFDFRLLPRTAVWVVVAQEGSFSAAARRLGVSRSVVSTQVRDLEEALGVRLLERTTRKVHLTGAGQQFYGPATRMLAAWREGCEGARSHAEAPQGCLRITCSGALTELLAPVVARYLARCPEVEVQLICTDRFVDLMDERIDIALRAGAQTDSSFIARFLARDREIIVGHPRVAAAWSSAKTPSDLRLARWVSHSALASGTSWTFWDAAEGEASLTVQPRVQVSTAAGLLDLVVAGVGLAVMPAWMASTAIRTGTLVQLLPTWWTNAAALFAVYRSRDGVPAKTRYFLELLSEEARGERWCN